MPRDGQSRAQGCPGARKMPDSWCRTILLAVFPPSTACHRTAPRDQPAGRLLAVISHPPPAFIPQAHTKIPKASIFLQKLAAVFGSAFQGPKFVPYRARMEGALDLEDLADMLLHIARQDKSHG